MRVAVLRSTLSRYRLLIFAFALGLIVRLLLAPLGWHGYDMFTYADWAWQLLEEPRGQFYAAPLEVPGDHLPGDLTVMWVIAHITHRFAPGLDFFDPAYVVILKLVPILCDLLLAIGVLKIGRIMTTERRAIAIASFAALNPAAIVVSAVWGQWDSVSMMLVVFAVLLLLRRRVAWALPVLAYACLLKPQLGVLVPFFAIADFRLWRESCDPTARMVSGRFPGMVRGWAIGGVASVALVLATCLPFGVGLPGMGTPYTIPERIDDALNRYDGTSMGAFNLWYAMFPDVRWDGLVAVGGLTYHMIGLALLAVGVLMALVGSVRIEPWPVALAWGATIATMSAFLLPTRAHERYLYPAMALSLLLAVVAPHLTWLAAGLSITSFLNVYLAFSAYHPAIDPPSLQHEAVLRTIAVVNLALFGAAVWWGIRAMLGERPGRRASQHRAYPVTDPASGT